MITAIKEITEHYTQTDLSTKILAALEQAGKDINALTRDDIAPIDEFHIRGRVATYSLAQRSLIWDAASAAQREH